MILLFTTALIFALKATTSIDLKNPLDFVVIGKTGDHDIYLKGLNTRKTIVLSVENAYDSCYCIGTVITIKR